MAYRYKIKDTDGDVSIIKFDFDFEKGCLVMEDEFHHLVAARAYPRAITEADVDTMMETFEESGEPQVDFSDEPTKTLLVMLVDEWCDRAEFVSQAASLFDMSRQLANTVTMMRIMAKKFDKEVPESPDIRVSNLSFLWDSFVFANEYQNTLSSDELSKLMQKAKEEIGVSQHIDQDDYEIISQGVPKALGYWALPIKIYDDLDSIIVRVPYDVMHDIYEDWKKVHEGYDPSDVSGQLPINITNEINEIVKKFNSRKQ